jgi:muramoyltetrapeptide carboxypeptidase
VKTIYAVAPGYPFDLKILKSSIEVLQNRGYRVILPKNILRPEYFHSHSDIQRAQFLIDAFTSDSIDVVWAIRGGYGSNRTLGYLDKNLSKLKTCKPKLFLGLSDVTSLHLFLNQKLKWKTWHSPVLEAIGRADFSKREFKNLEHILNYNTLDLSYPLKPLNKPAKSLKRLSPTRLLGGNLTVFQSHIGTPYLGSLKNSALFFEDVGERGYRIDRMLWQLRESSNFKDIRAIFFGEFTGGLEPDGKSFITLALKRFAEEVSIPVFAGIKSGHGQGYRSLPLGAAIAVEGQKLVLNP